MYYFTVCITLYTLMLNLCLFKNILKNHKFNLQNLEKYKKSIIFVFINFE